MLVKLLLLLTISSSLYAANRLDVVGKIVCNDRATIINEAGNLDLAGAQTIEGEYCTYTIQNLADVNELKRKVEQLLFNGDPLSPPDGILSSYGSNNQTIIFSHMNKTILNQMKKAIRSADLKQDFHPSDIIRIKADIFKVSETGLSNIGAGITNLRIGTGISDLASNRMISASDNGLSVDLKAGVVEVSGMIAAEKAKGNLERVTQLSGETYNLGKYEYINITKNFQAPGAGTDIKELEEGVRISAKASINADDSSIVVLTDFELYYGTQAVDGKINELRANKERLVLKEGILVPIVSAKSSGSMTNSSTRLFGFNRTITTENSKLLVYLSVETITWDEFMAELDLADFTVKKGFTLSEKQSLPDECPEMKEVLSAVNLHAVRGSDGLPMLSYSLDKSYACKKNIKKRIYVNMKGGGIGFDDNTLYPTVEELMHVPMKISGIQDRFYNYANIDFTLTLYPFNKKRQKVKHNLVYFKTNNHDIYDNFWLDDE